MYIECTPIYNNIIIRICFVKMLILNCGWSQVNEKHKPRLVKLYVRL